MIIHQKCSIDKNGSIRMWCILLSIGFLVAKEWNGFNLHEIFTIYNIYECCITLYAIQIKSVVYHYEIKYTQTMFAPFHLILLYCCHILLNVCKFDDRNSIVIETNTIKKKYRVYYMQHMMTYPSNFCM